MTEKVNAIIDIMKQRYGDAPCALHYEKDYQLMIAVRLSAQCTDARVNLVTPALFAAYPTLEDMATAPVEEVERLVHSCGFYKHKARDIVLGGIAADSRRWPQNRQFTAGRSVCRSRQRGLRHSLHSHLRPSGSEPRQRTREGGAAAAQNPSAGRKQRFLPPHCPLRPGNLYCPKSQMRGMSPDHVL